MKLIIKRATMVASAMLVAASAFAAYPTSEPIKSIPLPPAGQRWVVNEQLSDEFNGPELDKTKWLDHHSSGWKGRHPGLFSSENIEFFGGCMVLRGERMERDTVIGNQTWTITCAAVSSVEPTVRYGSYYECRMKANKAALSSTFWFSTEKGVSTEGHQPADQPQGMFSQELDVVECIGRDGDFEGSFFSNGMNSNVHYWLQQEGDKGRQDTRVQQSIMVPQDGKKPSDEFNIYGCWWRDSSSATFYLNNDQSQDRKFFSSADHKAPYDIEFYFTRPMHMHFVLETYPYPWIKVPTDEELSDPTRNRTFYDWVRTYDLVDADFANEGAAPMAMFDDVVNVTKKCCINKTSALELQYTASVDRVISVVVYDAAGDAVAKKSIAAPAGYANISVESLFAKGLKANSEYSVVAYLGDADVDSEYLSGDSFSAKMTK